MCSCIYSFVDSLDHVIRRSVMLLLVNFSKVMKTELKKRQPDRDLLSTLMDLTFSEEVEDHCGRGKCERPNGRLPCSFSRD